MATTCFWQVFYSDLVKRTVYVPVELSQVWFSGAYYFGCHSLVHRLSGSSHSTHRCGPVNNLIMCTYALCLVCARPWVSSFRNNASNFSYCVEKTLNRLGHGVLAYHYKHNRRVEDSLRHLRIQPSIKSGNAFLGPNFSAGLGHALDTLEAYYTNVSDLSESNRSAHLCVACMRDLTTR